MDKQKRLEAYLEKASEMGLTIHEEKMQCHNGLLIGRDIIIREDLPTLAKKTDSNNRRQEHKARLPSPGTS